MIRFVPRVLARNGWRPVHMLCMLILAGVGLALTWDAWSDLVRIAWKDEESSHALLVPIIAAWLFWVRRGRMRYCRPVGYWIGPVLALIGAAMYLSGDTYLIESFWHGGAVLVVVGCVLTILGRDVLKEFFPVFLVLVFLVPVPGRVRQRIAIPLQRATAEITQDVCEFGGVSVNRSGNLLTINGVDVAVAEACNGMRMTFALVLVSFAFAMTAPLRWYVRALVVLLSPLSAVFYNVIRLVPTVWVFGNCRPTFASTFHDISGWVMLFVAFVSLMGVIRLLQWMAVPVAPFPLVRD